MFLPGIRAILIFVFNFSRWNKIYLSKKTLPENSRQLSVNSSANYSYYHWEEEKDGVEKCSLFGGYKKEIQLVKYFLSKLQLLSKVFKKLSIFKNYFYLDRYSRLKNIKISINIVSLRFKNFKNISFEAIYSRFKDSKIFIEKRYPCFKLFNILIRRIFNFLKHEMRLKEIIVKRNSIIIWIIQEEGIE